MTSPFTPHRRAVLGLLAGAATAPSMAGAATLEAFEARCRRLSGFAVIPLDLLAALHRALPEDVADQPLLEALYTGVVPERHDDGNPKRVAYPDALMYLAIEDWANTPSFCGGLPGFWAYPPESA